MILVHLYLLLALFDKVEFNTEETRNHLTIAITSDKGLCGAFHANVARKVKGMLAEYPKDKDVGLVCVGDRVKGQLQRVFSDKLVLHFAEFGRFPPTFDEASFIAREILQSGYEFHTGEILYNRFK